MLLKLSDSSALLANQRQLASVSKLNRRAFEYRSTIVGGDMLVGHSLNSFIAASPTFRWEVSTSQV
jgi:hypothetical protein